MNITVRNLLRFLIIITRYTQKTSTLFTATIALLLFLSNCLKLIIKCQLFIRTYRTACEEADSQFAIYSPLLCLAVWIATVVEIATNISLLCRVDKKIIMKRHKVKMFIILGGVFFGSFLESLYVYDFANIFYKKCVPKRPFSYFSRQKKINNENYTYVFSSLRVLNPHPLNSVRNG